MSLNHHERTATSQELRSNLQLSALSLQEVQTELGMNAARLQATLAVAAAQPADVWLLRDYLERVIYARGVSPRPYSALTPDMRGAAGRWFPSRGVDDVMSGGFT